MKITFRFRGGFLDGQAITGDTDLRRANNSARRYVFLSDCGRVGKRFREFPPERCEKIRAVLAEKNKERDDTLETVLQRTMEQIDCCNPPSADVLRKMFYDTARKLGVDGSRCLQECCQETDELNRQLECIKSQIFEVASRQVRSDGIVVDIQYVGEDVGETMDDV